MVWLTGLPASGNSTIAERVASALVARGVRVERLDGDAHIQRVGYLASRLEANDVFVVASFVSPYTEARGQARRLCRRFIEVHVSTPLVVCEARDPKGLYAKAHRAEVRNFTGVDDPYEAPEAPELRLHTSAVELDRCATEILARADV